MEERCVACHEDAIGAIRGVLAVQLGAHPAEPGSCSTAELEATIDTSLRYIMLSELGRRIADFLEEAAATSAVRQLILYDAAGRVYWNTRHRKPTGDIAAALTSSKSTFRFKGKGESERVHVVEPLRNKKTCMRCHGSDSPVRGVVAVSLSTAAAARERAASLQRRTQFTLGTLIGILVILIGVLQYLVVRRVSQIGDVADAVGEGDLGVEVRGARADGDEIARLGDRVNHMVRGLRTKMHLEKFVSKGTALAASSADLAPISRTGESRDVTVLFSDIRGFTAYSEQVSPESVVEMLNRLLRAQAEVVREFGGDIDKYVGDELLAVFEGDGAAERAVRCARKMIQAVHEVRVSNLAVGVGISAGDVVYGAVGHEERMDFTVIGDVVNTGARLCSAAAPDEILVTEAVRDAIATTDVELESVEPISVKGKREPLAVYLVKA
jgi:adenylate cyclase